MIEVEIRGPIAKKDYEKIKKLLAAAGEVPYQEQRIFIDYSMGERADRTIDICLKRKNDVSEFSMKRSLAGDCNVSEGIEPSVAPDEISNAVKIFAALGHTKGMVSMREMLYARYGGVEFTLIDPGEDLFYYEANITVSDPESAKEAKFKLDQLAKKMKLPIWGQSEMTAFMKRLNERVNYLYDYEVQGSEHFKERFGI